MLEVTRLHESEHSPRQGAVVAMVLTVDVLEEMAAVSAMQLAVSGDLVACSLPTLPYLATD